MSIEYRVLERNELDIFYDLDRSEIVDNVYYYRNGELELEDEHYDIPDWDREEKAERIQQLRELYDRGGAIIGAFVDDEFAGLITLDNRRMGKNTDMLNLEGLWVSNRFRNMGIATELVRQVCNLARTRKANFLYVSATESKNTVEFYKNRGFSLIDDPDPVLLEKEPRDIHMVKQL